MTLETVTVPLLGSSGKPESGITRWTENASADILSAFVLRLFYIRDSSSSSNSSSRPVIQLGQWRQRVSNIGGDDLPLPFSPPLPSLLPTLPPSPPSPPLPLEVGPLNPARGSGGALLAPSAGSGAEPQPRSNLVHFSLKIRHLVAKK